MLLLSEVVKNAIKHSEIERDRKLYVIELLDNSMSGSYYYVTEETLNEFNPNTIRVKCVVENGKTI